MQSDERSGVRHVLTAAWIVWAISLAYSMWSYSRVFPVFLPIDTEGDLTELTFGYLPRDTYTVSLIIGLSGDEASMPNARFRLAEKLEGSLDAFPVDINLLILDGRDNEVVGHDSGQGEWHVGTRHSFDETWTFDQSIHMFNTIEFEGTPLARYRLRASVETENPLIEGRKMHLLVAGRRDDGYYPLFVMIYIGLSFFVLLILAIVSRIFGNAGARRNG